MSAQPPDRRKIYVEFFVQGNAVRATAIDSATGIEASIVGPAGAPRATLEAAAVRKLTHILKQKRGES